MLHVSRPLLSSQILTDLATEMQQTETTSYDPILTAIIA